MSFQPPVSQVNSLTNYFSVRSQDQLQVANTTQPQSAIATTVPALASTFHRGEEEEVQFIASSQIDLDLSQQTSSRSASTTTSSSASTSSSSSNCKAFKKAKTNRQELFSNLAKTGDYSPESRDWLPFVPLHHYVFKSIDAKEYNNKKKNDVDRPEKKLNTKELQECCESFLADSNSTRERQGCVIKKIERVGADNSSTDIFVLYCNICHHWAHLSKRFSTSDSNFVKGWSLEPYVSVM
jgi:hypothetical protein